MADINQIYNPNITPFFNEEGYLVIGNTGGAGDQWQNGGWGSNTVLPNASSILGCEVILYNLTSGFLYSPALDIVPLPYRFLITNQQVVITAEPFTSKIDLVNSTVTPNDSPIFEEGIYSVIINYNGFYENGTDRVTWASSTQDIGETTEIYLNLISPCFIDARKSLLFSNGCRNEKYRAINDYWNMAKNYMQDNIDNGQNSSNYYLGRQSKLQDIYAKIKDNCLNCNCQC
jgi:hypothetical protein